MDTLVTPWGRVAGNGDFVMPALRAGGMYGWKACGE